MDAPNPLKKSQWDTIDTVLERGGKKIILPGDPAEMPIDDAIKALKRIKADEDQEFNVHEIIDAHPVDAIVSFVLAMRELYGWTSPVPTPGFFGPTPPRMLSIKTGPDKDDVMQVPWGSFKLPNVENLIGTVNHMHEGRPVLIIHGTVRKKERGVVLELAQLTRDILKTNSIFKGKAFTIPVDDDGDLQVMEPPTFMDVRKADPKQLLLNADVIAQVNTNLWGPIQNTEACRTHKIPLKRGVLLEGPYGCGKSLTASITAKIAQDNGWTFINLDKVQGLKAALEFANRYQPAVIFAEDIDRMMEERDEEANDLINTIDGVLSKNAEVMVVLTTNHIDKIQQVMLRPGRLDAVISIPAPDAKTVEALVRMYARTTLDATTDLTEIGLKLQGQIPATVREVVERSKLAMLVRGEKSITAEALSVSAEGMTQHLALLNRKKDEPTDAQKFYDGFKKLIGGGDGASPEEVGHELKGVISNHSRAIRRDVAGAANAAQEATSAAAGSAEQTKKSEKNIRAEIKKALA